MRRLARLAVVALCAWGSAYGAETGQLATCEKRLARSLDVMQERPLLKAEVATALMWLRLDAEAALKQGNGEACTAKLRVIEGILGLATLKDTQGHRQE